MCVKRIVRKRGHIRNHVRRPVIYFFQRSFNVFYAAAPRSSSSIRQTAEFKKRHRRERKRRIYFYTDARTCKRIFATRPRGRRCWVHERNGYTDQRPPPWLRVFGGPRAQGLARDRAPYLLHNRGGERDVRYITQKTGPRRNYGVFARHVGPEKNENATKRELVALSVSSRP